MISVCHEFHVIIFVSFQQCRDLGIAFKLFNRGTQCEKIRWRSNWKSRRPTIPVHSRSAKLTSKSQGLCRFFGGGDFIWSLGECFSESESVWFEISPKNHVFVFWSTDFFFWKYEKKSNIKIEAKFDCGSNASTLSLGITFRGTIILWKKSPPKIYKIHSQLRRYITTCSAAGHTFIGASQPSSRFWNQSFDSMTDLINIIIYPIRGISPGKKIKGAYRMLPTLLEKAKNTKPVPLVLQNKIFW